MVLRTTDDRGQVEPLAAIAGVFAVCIGLGMVATVFHTAAPTDARSIAGPTLDRTAAAVVVGGAVDPAALETLEQPAPPGYRANVTLRTLETRHHRGPTPPPGAERASRPVSVRLRPGVNRPGTLTVAVWRV